ncbi:dihydrodipicolinate synthase family protein [Telmatospirillum sp. J64-1]|uniref:dihydrodipicolinate synthase family protein n=1 Tax=Telmatospirillum sp. J64-1 TaxID=2502183 RepID=UPI00115E44E0|nr:dihydrodipicolinate synthase family protein [Telmatospirillum sp. J64-1]
MKKESIAQADLTRSVISVPPLALNADFSLNEAENRRLIEWMHAGGVTTYLYGGNANLYNYGAADFPALLDMLERICPEDGWMIPSVGADYGKALDQLRLLRDRDFPTAMVLPLTFPSTSQGLATGLRRLADAYGRQLIAYIKTEDFLAPKDLAALFADGVLCSVKYAVVREQPSHDPYLAALVDAAGSDRIVSGIGERPVIDHVQGFGLTGFTSGSVCLAPRLSTAILHALRDGEVEKAAQLREMFLPLEDLRDAHSPIRVLHAAVRLGGVADTGPMMPFLSELDDPAVLDRIAAAATALRQADQSPAGAALPV